MTDAGKAAARAISAEMGLGQVPMTPEQHAEFARRLEERMAEWDGKYQVLPAPDPRELRDFLKANATVVAPGETLVIRAPDLTPGAMREVMEVLNWAGEDGPYLPFRTVVVPGDGFAVAPEILTLVAEGKMSVNDARKALGLPTWPVPEFDEAREVP